MSSLFNKTIIVVLLAYIICIHLIFLKRIAIKNTNNNEINIDEKKIYDINFDYLNYERNIITEKMFRYAHWQLSEKQVYL